METAEQRKSDTKCSIPVDLQIKSLGAKNVSGRIGLLGTLDAISSRLGKPVDRLRILELGAGEANLAAWIIETEKIKPENYVISDITYDPDRMPALQRDIAELVRFRLMRALQLDILEKPGQIGQFDLIFMSFFLGSPECLRRFISNYFDKLNTGGMIVATSAQYSYARINALTEKLARNPFLQIEQLDDDERETLALTSQLHTLKEDGDIADYANPSQLFHKNEADIPNMIFMLQRIG